MITLKNLSEMTGYSITTISRVLNNDKTLRASNKTKEIIKTIAKSTGYKTIQSKKNRSKPKSNLIKKIYIGIADSFNMEEYIKDPYYMYLKEFVEQECLKKKVELIKLQYDEKKEIYSIFPNKKVSGIITIGNFSETRIKAIRKITDNIVFLDSAPRNGKYSSVVVDLELGIKRGLDYLLECGHKRIFFVGPKTAPNALNRAEPEIKRKAFIEYIKEKNIEEFTQIIDCERSIENAYQMITKFINEKNQLPTAFVTVNESVTIGILNALNNCNIRVPEDVSILNYNNTVYSAFVNPPLSSISINSEYMSKIAVDLIVKQFESKEYYPIQVSVFPEILERESVKKLKI